MILSKIGGLQDPSPPAFSEVTAGGGTDLNTTQISCFLEVARQLSFARAAESLYSSQPVVSYQIKSLEEELGLKLFTRSNRAVALTEAGTYLYTRLGPISRQISESVTVAQAIQSRERSIILLLVRRLTDYSNLTRTIKDFSDTHPSTQVDIFTQNDTGTCKLLLSGKIQLAFCYQFEIPSHSRLRFLPLKRIDYYVLVNKEHPLALYKQLTLKDLNGERLVLAESELQKNSGLISRSELEKHGIHLSPICSTFDGMLLTVESGVGFTILPCDTKKRFSGLIKIPVKDLSHTAVGLAWDPSSAGPAVLEFIELAKTGLKK